MDKSINMESMNEIAKKFEELNNISKQLQNLVDINKLMDLPLDKKDTILKSIPKNMFNEIIKLNTLSESLSSIQKICLLKYLPHEETNDKINKRLNRISKNDTVNLFNSDIEYDVNKNRFYKNDEIIGLDIVKKCGKASSFFDNITMDELIDFIQYCYKTPLLASNHEVGKKIYLACKKLEKENLFEIGQTSFYRARTCNDIFPLTEEEMCKAPFGVSPQGRFNSTGVGVFYLADTTETACAEVNKHSEIKQKIQIAEFINKKRLYVLDIRDWKNEFSKFCLRSVEMPRRANKEYIIPNYFSDCLKQCGIDGILYKNDDNANLYAFFKDDDFECINPNYKNVYGKE